MIIPPGVFLIFLKFSFFGLLVGIKGLKIAQSEEKKQLHRTSAISQEQYNICSLFLVHLYKMISPGYHFTQVKFCVFYFFIFSKFFNFFFKFLFIRLFGWWWGEGGGEANILSLELHVSETIHDMTLINGTHV